MADVFAVFGLLLALGIVFPGMLTTWWLLFPAAVERARLRMARTPWACFWLGGVSGAALLIPIAILLAQPSGPAKFTGGALIVMLLAFASLGAAGVAAYMSQRLRLASEVRTSPARAFVQAAVALELAAAFPIIGWLIVIPLTVVTALGASAFALMRWVPAAGPAPAGLTEPAAPLS